MISHFLFPRKSLELCGIKRGLLFQRGRRVKFWLVQFSAWSPAYCPVTRSPFLECFGNVGLCRSSERVEIRISFTSAVSGRQETFGTQISQIPSISNQTGLLSARINDLLEIFPFVFLRLGERTIMTPLQPFDCGVCPNGLSSCRGGSNVSWIWLLSEEVREVMCLPDLCQCKAHFLKQSHPVHSCCFLSSLPQSPG